MAKPAPAPSTHLIEPARSGRSSCQTCGKPISEGELRLSEAYVKDEGPVARALGRARTQERREYSEDSEYRRNEFTVSADLGARFHHLACAAQHQPYMLRFALAGALASGIGSSCRPSPASIRRASRAPSLIPRFAFCVSSAVPMGGLVVAPNLPHPLGEANTRRLRGVLCCASSSSSTSIPTR